MVGWLVGCGEQSHRPMGQWAVGRTSPLLHGPTGQWAVGRTSPLPHGRQAGGLLGRQSHWPISEQAGWLLSKQDHCPMGGQRCGLPRVPCLWLGWSKSWFWQEKLWFWSKAWDLSLKLQTEVKKFDCRFGYTRTAKAVAPRANRPGAHGPTVWCCESVEHPDNNLHMNRPSANSPRQS